MPPNFPPSDAYMSFNAKKQDQKSSSSSSGLSGSGSRKTQPEVTGAEGGKSKGSGGGALGGKRRNLCGERRVDGASPA